MKAIVIGGGIGGLTAAIALDKTGIEAHVFERAPAFREVGAGLSLWANALRALEALGLGNSMRARLLPGVHGDVRTWQGAILSAPAPERRAESDGMTIGVVHRAELLALLSSQVDVERVHFNHECTGFTSDAAGVTAQFANGESVRGDVLIGADGLHSIVRAQSADKTSPRYSGYTAWRGVAQFKQSALVPGESWGRGQRFGVVPMRDGLVYWYATKNAPEGQRDSQEGVKHDLLRLFHGWHDSIEALIEATEERAILRNDIYDRDPLLSWSQGRVTLLGDAAHPMSPNMGQGACQAIEDAVVLAVCLATATDVASGLRQYQERRIARTSRVVLLSRRIGRMAQWDIPFLCFVRDLGLRLSPPSMATRQLGSVIAFDPLTEQERALLAGGTSVRK